MKKNYIAIITTDIVEDNGNYVFHCSFDGIIRPTYCLFFERKEMLYVLSADKSSSGGYNIICKSLKAGEKLNYPSGTEVAVYE